MEFWSCTGESLPVSNATFWWNSKVYVEVPVKELTVDNQLGDSTRQSLVYQIVYSYGIMMFQPVTGSSNESPEERKFRKKKRL